MDKQGPLSTSTSQPSLPPAVTPETQETKVSKPAERLTFGRVIRRIGNALPFLHKNEAVEKTPKPQNRSILSRKAAIPEKEAVVLAAVSAREKEVDNHSGLSGYSKPRPLHEVPGSGKAKIVGKPLSVQMNDLKKRIGDGEALSIGLKEGMVKVKNTYAMAGLRVLKAQVKGLEQEISEKKSVGLDTTWQEGKLEQARQIETGFKSQINDSWILSSSSSVEVGVLFGRLEQFPERLQGLLVNLQLRDENHTLEAFHEAVNEQIAYEAQIRNVQVTSPAPEDSGFSSSRSHKELFDVQEMHLKSALTVTQDAIDTEKAKVEKGFGDVALQRKLHNYRKEWGLKNMIVLFITWQI